MKSNDSVDEDDMSVSLLLLLLLLLRLDTGTVQQLCNRDRVRRRYFMAQCGGLGMHVVDGDVPVSVVAADLEATDSAAATSASKSVACWAAAPQDMFAATKEASILLGLIFVRSS